VQNMLCDLGFDEQKCFNKQNACSSYVINLFFFSAKNYVIFCTKHEVLECSQFWMLRKSSQRSIKDKDNESLHFCVSFGTVHGGRNTLRSNESVIWA
jgi:hypothetical protein